MYLALVITLAVALNPSFKLTPLGIITSIFAENVVTPPEELLAEATVFNLPASSMSLNASVIITASKPFERYKISTSSTSPMNSTV